MAEEEELRQLDLVCNRRKESAMRSPEQPVMRWIRSPTV